MQNRHDAQGNGRLASPAETVASRLPAGPFLTVADVASALGVTSGAVYSWIDEGRFPVLDLGGGRRRSVRIQKADFLEFIKSRTK